MRAIQLITTLALAVPAALGAQSSVTPTFDTKGFFVGAAVGEQALHPMYEASSRSRGRGTNLLLGYGIRPRLALYVSAVGGTMDRQREPWELVHVDFGARYHFTAEARRLVPFVELALSSLVADATSDLAEERVTGELSGTALTIGVGTNFYLSPRVALTASAVLSSGAFTTVTASDGMHEVSMSGLMLDVTTRRVQVGVTWYPRRGRS